MPDMNWLTSPSGSEFLHYLACKGPADVDTVAREFNVHRNNVRKIFRGAHAYGVVHVARYERIETLARQPVKVWELGPGEDAARTLYGRSKRHEGRWETAESASRILARLTRSDCTVKVLMNECYLTDTATRSQLRQMVAAGAVHLCGYTRAPGQGGNWSKVYRIGQGKPAKVPSKQTQAVKSAKYKAWRKRKIDAFGYETAQRMFRARKNGGADVIVQDGVVVYRRSRKA